MARRKAPFWGLVIGGVLLCLAFGSHARGSVPKEAPAGNAAPTANAPAGYVPEAGNSPPQTGKRAPASSNVATPPAPRPAPPTIRGATDASPAQSPTTTTSIDVSKWRELWSVPIGSVEDDGGSVGLGQIAPRGPMIVVASRGVPNKDDEADGVHIIDGRADVDAAHRTVRVIKSPDRPGHAPGATDAIGVAIDGDFVVFGTYGGLVTRVRLDGVVDWVSDPFPEKTRPGLPALVDVNGDGRLDVLVPIEPMTTCAEGATCGPEWNSLAFALDGKSGKVMWKLELGAGSGGLHGIDNTDRSHRIVVLNDSTEGAIVDTTHAIPTVPMNGLAGSIFLLESEGSTTQAYFPFQVNDGQALVRREGPHDLSFDVGLDVDNPISIGVASLVQPSTSLLITHPSGSPEAHYELGAPVQSPPSLADVNGDGAWDVLVVAGGALRAISTGSTGDAGKPLWLYDLAATGHHSSVLDSPAAYASRVDPRDASRWLEPSKAPSPESFAGLAALDPGPKVERAPIAPLEREPIELEREPKGLVVAAQTDCGGTTYGASEGTLVVEDGSTWQKVPDAPWPVVALGCSDGALVTEAPEGTRYAMREPWPWQRCALAMLALFSAASALATVYTSRKRAKHPATSSLGAEGGAAPRTRRAIVPDGARTDPKDALESQDRLIKGLLNVLDNDDTRPPVTVALYGAWGTGKSSVMQMLRSELKATGRYIDVWFNAWRFQRENELAPALLQSIVDEVGRQSDWVTRIAVIWNRVRRATAREVFLVAAPAIVVSLVLAVSVHGARHGDVSTTNRSTTLISSALLFVGATHRLIVPLFKVFSLDPAKLLSSGDSTKRIQFVREFSREFEEISRKLPDGTRLIVFIDDLDRCAPDRIVNVLETLSMLADTGCGFFVVAMDPVTVKRAIELTYKDLLRVARREDPAEAAAFGSRYLEKMITLGVNVPVLPAADVIADARLDARLAPMKPLDWLWARVLPGKPLLFTMGVLALLAAFGYRRADLVEAGLDLGSSWLNPPEASTSASAASSKPAAQAPPAAALAPTTAAGPTPPAGLAPAPSRSERATPLARRAPVLDPPRPPAVVEGPAAQAPAVARRWSEWVVFGFGAVFGVPLLGIALLVLGDSMRRRRIREAGPMGTDSKAFGDAFATMKHTFVETPRNVVRFTNLARFLYSVVAERADSRPDTEDWAPSFFKLLEARWKGSDESDSSCPRWLTSEMDRWLPGGDFASPRAVAPPGANGSHTTKRPPPASSGPQSIAPDRARGVP